MPTYRVFCKSCDKEYTKRSTIAESKHCSFCDSQNLEIKPTITAIAFGAQAPVATPAVSAPTTDTHVCSPGCSIHKSNSLIKKYDKVIS